MKKIRLISLCLCIGLILTGCSSFIDDETSMEISQSIIDKINGDAPQREIKNMGGGKKRPSSTIDTNLSERGTTTRIEEGDIGNEYFKVLYDAEYTKFRNLEVFIEDDITDFTGPIKSVEDVTVPNIRSLIGMNSPEYFEYKTFSLENREILENVSMILDRKRSGALASAGPIYFYKDLNDKFIKVNPYFGYDDLFFNSILQAEDKKVDIEGATLKYNALYANDNLENSASGYKINATDEEIDRVIDEKYDPYGVLDIFFKDKWDTDLNNFEPCEIDPDDLDLTLSLNTWGSSKKMGHTLKLSARPKEGKQPKLTVMEIERGVDGNETNDSLDVYQEEIYYFAVDSEEEAMEIINYFKDKYGMVLEQGDDYSKMIHLESTESTKSPLKLDSHFGAKFVVDAPASFVMRNEYGRYQLTVGIKYSIF